VFLLAKSILTYRLKIAMYRLANKSKLMFSPDRKIEEIVQNRVIELKFPEFSPYKVNDVEIKNTMNIEELENIGKHSNCSDAGGLGQPVGGEEVD
jgi:hypothetical protein